MQNEPKLGRRVCSALALLVVTGATMALAGCTSYAVPGRGADLRAFGVSRAGQDPTDPAIRTQLEREPLVRFPTAIAAVRVQECGYRSLTNRGWGQGRYSVVTVRDVERPEHFERLAKLPMVQGITPVNRLQLPAELKSDLDLRSAAAQLHAQVLLIYTLDTTFTVDEKGAPLTLITLGLAPNRVARVTCTAAALLMDTRNGYLYGVAESTDKESGLTTSWTSQETVDDCRRRVEARAFERLVGELEATWRGVVHQYAGNIYTTTPAETH